MELNSLGVGSNIVIAIQSTGVLKTTNGVSNQGEIVIQSGGKIEVK